MTARKTSYHFLHVSLCALFAIALALVACGSAGAAELFHETFNGYTSFWTQDPPGDPVNPGLPQISEGAAELWYGGRFEAPDNGTIQQDLAVQKYGGFGDFTPVGRAEDNAALLFNVSTLGFASANLDFDWRLFDGDGATFHAGYYAGTIGGWSADRTQSFVAPNAYQWSNWTQFATTGSNSFSHVNVVLPGGEPSIWVAFFLDGHEGDYGKIDNIVVVSGQQVPEPATFVLASFGIVAVGFVAIRRRARAGNPAALRALATALRARCA